MANQSLLTDEIRAFEGRTGPSSPVQITSELVKRSMGVYRDAGPVHFPPGSVVPGAVLLILAPNGHMEALRVPVSLPRSLMVSTEFSVERPLRMDESFQARARVASISERLGGQHGHGLYIRTEVEFLDSSGLVAGRTATTMMHFDNQASPSEGPR